MITSISEKTKLSNPNISRNFSGNTMTIKKTKAKDEFVLHLLKKELTEAMPEAEANIWLVKIQQICKKNNLKLENLPINEKQKGSLSEKENSNLFTEIFYSVFSDLNKGKIELKADK